MEALQNAKKRMLFALLATALTATAGAADLAEVYKLAAESDPILREAEANYRAAREAKPQAWAAYLPQINGSISDSSSDDAGTSSRFSGGTFIDTIDDTSTDQTVTTLELRQTIFNWSKIKNIRSAGAAAAQAESEFRYAQQLFIVRVAERYFGQLAASDTLEAARANREAIARQLEQAKKRFEVGLIAVTDVEESQAAYDQATADEIAAERALASAREVLRESTGVFIEELTRPGDELPLITPEPAAPEEWVKLANDQNNALIASRFAAESAAHALGSAWGAHYPTLDFVADRTKFESETTGTIDVGTVVPINTATDTEGDTVRLQLTVPIFAGGGTQSGVRQARFRSQAADQRLERVTRETQRQARDALLGVTSEIARVKALKQSVASSTTALRATEAGFDVGTRTTVDVLNGRRTLLQAHVNYRKSKYDYLLNTLRLKQAAGMLAETDVGLVNGWMISSPSAPVLPNPGDAKPRP